MHRKGIFYLRINEKGNPAHNNKKSGGQVVSYNIEGCLPREHQLEARHGVVHVERGVAGVLGVERVDVDIIVEDGSDGLLLDWDEFISEINIHEIFAYL